ERAGLLRETRLQLNNISFLVGNNDNEDSRQIVKVFAIPATRIYDVIDKRLRQNLCVITQLGVETTLMEHSACRCWDRPSMLKHELTLVAFAASAGAACTSCNRSELWAVLPYLAERLWYTAGLTSASGRCKLAKLRVDLEQMDLHFQRTNCWSQNKHEIKGHH
ncbi:hypothetical protein JG688_00011042, partial [Phytophthora aleatoria]